MKQHELWPKPKRAKGELPATADREAPAERWTTGGNVDRSGAAKYVHLMRAPDDPDKLDAPRGGGKRDPIAWRKCNQTTAAEWSRRIVALLDDGRPRTFNAICLELVARTADVMFEQTLDRGLWLAVGRGDVEHTMDAPILFRRRRP